MEDISVEIQRQKGGPSVLPHLKQVVSTLNLTSHSLKV